MRRAKALLGQPDAASLNRPPGPAGGLAEIGVFVEDGRASDTPGEVMRQMESVRLREMVGRLPEKERYGLIRRYGLDDRDTATLARLGEELGISRERVRQLQNQVEGLLRAADRKRRVLRDAVTCG